MSPLPRPEFLTFDCFGTLIDWRGGILRSLRPILEGKPWYADEFFRVWWQIDRRLTQEAAYRPYRQILFRDFAETFEALEVPHVDEGTLLAMVESLPHWDPFPEVPARLKQLHEAGFRLGILSNVDDDLLAPILDRLDVPFDLVVTAEQIESYKPAPQHWETALKRVDRPPSAFCHVAGSLQVDVVPAKALGWRTVHLVRHEPDAETDVKPDHRISDLAELLALFPR